MDIHEILFSRGDVTGHGERAILAIMDPRNCGPAHRENCHKMAEGGEGQLRAIAYLIRYEGYTSVRKFAEEMSFLITSHEQVAKLSMANDRLLQLVNRHWKIV
jgi:hypothetical protein